MPPPDQALQHKPDCLFHHARLDDVRCKPGQLRDPTCMPPVNALGCRDLGDGGSRAP